MKRDFCIFSIKNLGGKIFVVAEVAQAHDGSLGNAHAYIEAAAAVGVDAVKFQTHIAEAESTPSEPWRVMFSYEDKRRFDYWKRMEFRFEQWRELKSHAEEKGLMFLSTPFSVEAVELLEKIGMPIYKIGSADIDNFPMLDVISKTKMPVIFSTGMSTWKEIGCAAKFFADRDIEYSVMQCTTAYPCPPEKLGLNLINELESRYNCPVGFSDHSGEIYSNLAAAALGAKIIEFHLTFSKYCFGPDTKASLDIDQAKELVRGVRFLEQGLREQSDKSVLDLDTTFLKETFGRSLVARCDMRAGDRLELKNILARKISGGLPPNQYFNLEGKKLKKDIKSGEIIKSDYVEA